MYLLAKDSHHLCVFTAILQQKLNSICSVLRVETTTTDSNKNKFYFIFNNMINSYKNKLIFLFFSSFSLFSLKSIKDNFEQQIKIARILQTSIIFLFISISHTKTTSDSHRQNERITIFVNIWISLSTWNYFDLTPPR